MGMKYCDQYICMSLCCVCMKGTSTDVSRFAGQFEHVFETTVAGVMIQAPQVCVV